MEHVKDKPRKQHHQPGIEAKMDPAPEYIKSNYVGSKKLLDKVALITGGDSGIGRAISVHFAREGADVAIVYLDEDIDAKETKRLVEAEGRKCLALNDSTLTGQQLAGAVEDLGNFANTDGMIFDTKGNLYLGDPTTYSMVQITPDLKMHSWIKDERLIWPDTYSISKDGYMYISTSQIQRQPDYNNGENKRTGPYVVYKIKLPDQ